MVVAGGGGGGFGVYTPTCGKQYGNNDGGTPYSEAFKLSCSGSERLAINGQYTNSTSNGEDADTIGGGGGGGGYIGGQSMTYYPGGGGTSYINNASFLHLISSNYTVNAYQNGYINITFIYVNNNTLTLAPTTMPTTEPTMAPTVTPSTAIPTHIPTTMPTIEPTMAPTQTSTALTLIKNISIPINATYVRIEIAGYVLYIHKMILL